MIILLIIFTLFDMDIKLVKKNIFCVLWCKEIFILRVCWSSPLTVRKQNNLDAYLPNESASRYFDVLNNSNDQFEILALQRSMYYWQYITMMLACFTLCWCDDSFHYCFRQSIWFSLNIFIYLFITVLGSDKLCRI